MRYFKFLLPLLCINHAIAQYNTTGTLTKVNEDGLHEIRLPNAIRSFSNVDLSDFRIFDNGVEVPYFISAQDHVLTTNKYIAFEIMSRAVSKDTSSSIVFKNNLKSISEVVLFVANYAGSKTFNLSGSHNLKDWFGVLNQGVLSNLESANTVSVIKTITFPRCAYQYIKITFNDKNSLPINVLKIGRVYNDTTYKKRQIVSPLTQVISELKGDKKTVIETSFKNNEVINQIQFNVTSPEFYNRNVSVYTKALSVTKQQNETYKKQLAQFRLSSDGETTFNIPEIKTDHIFIEIDNKDSQSLVFGAILFFQNPIYVIASLKKNTVYTIKTGLKSSKAPEYDLSFFRNAISKNLPKVDIQNIVNQKPIEVVKPITFWQTPWFMWTCISISGLVILFFISNLIKDLKKD